MDPRPDPEILQHRLESIRQALGATRLGFGRKMGLMAPGPSPFQLLGVVGEGIVAGEPLERSIPLLAMHRLLGEGTPCVVAQGDADPVADWLRRAGFQRLQGWCMPLDRLPTMAFVALERRARTRGARRDRVGLAGMDALARSLSGPGWLDLRRSDRSSECLSTDRLQPLALLGESRATARLRDAVRGAAPHPGSVVLEGEIGTGKRELMVYLHRQLRERACPIVDVGPSQIGEWLDRGVPAGEAVAFRDPWNWSNTHQQELARRLGDRALRPRWLYTLSERNLEREVDLGSLSAALYLRLVGARLRLAPLRERPRDLPGILIEILRRRTDLAPFRWQVKPALSRSLQRRPWPANLRDLEALAGEVLERAPRGGRIDLDEAGLVPRTANPVEPAVTTEPPLSLAEAMRSFERALIQRALQCAEGNKAEAARVLRLSRQGLYGKLRRHGLLEGDDA